METDLLWCRREQGGVGIEICQEEDRRNEASHTGPRLDPVQCGHAK